jgi:hypothetical protein
MFNWTFNQATQQLRAPSGLTITVKEIARWIQDRAYHRYDLTGPWQGWHVCGRFLKGPDGIRLTPDELRHPEH